MSVYSQVTCSKCQRPCWNICYLRGQVICAECLTWFVTGNPWIRARAVSP